jgi:hypothetical protein
VVANAAGALLCSGAVISISVVMGVSRPSTVRTSDGVSVISPCAFAAGARPTFKTTRHNITIPIHKVRVC